MLRVSLPAQYFDAVGWVFKTVSLITYTVLVETLTPGQFNPIRTIELILSGLTYDICLVYLDNILVFSKTFDEQCERLATIFDRLERHTLKLKATKCHLFHRSASSLPWACRQR